MTGSPESVLVLGNDTRSFLAVVRALGRRGIQVHAAPANFRSAALHSRYIAAIHYLPPWFGDGNDWLEAFRALLLRERFRLIIPCHEAALLPIQHARAELEPLTRLAIPDDRAIAVLFDKAATRELAASLGIPIAPGRRARPSDRGAAVLAELGTPVMVKPRHSYSLSSLDRRGRVVAVRSAAAFDQWIATAAADQHVLEAFRPGGGVGVSVLASRGRILQAFQHERVREDGGGGYYRVSAALAPDMLHGCEQMLQALTYTGLAMFEFRRDPATGAWVLLEVNARPWGSLPLPVALGVDFPFRWYRLLVEGMETPPVPYRTGIYARNLRPDLSVMLGQARARPTLQRPLFLLRRAGELGRVLRGREVQDSLVRDDPAPGLQELASLASAVGTKLARGIPGTRCWARAQARRLLRTALHRSGGTGELVFVCLGNICRSPFAEAALRRALGGRAPGLCVSSSGTMPRPGRRTPEFGLIAAREHGIQLALHRSTVLSLDAARDATAIIVFDPATAQAVMNRYPNLPGPVLRLGALAPAARLDIADPVDGDLGTFRQTYDAIAESVGGLAQLILRTQATGAPEHFRFKLNRKCSSCLG